MLKTNNDIEAILKVGKVISVKGRFIQVLVDKSKNASHLIYNGEIIKNVSVGSYVKICKGFVELVGKIEGEYITEEKNSGDKSYFQEKEKIFRILSISILGYFEGIEFKQGIKELPLIENECFLLKQNEFDKIHNFIKLINGILDEKICIGSLANEKGKKIELGVNSLFASHIGIFGNTGSGKSYTLASLYHSLFKLYSKKKGFKKNAKFIIFDFNGEYSKESCILREKRVYHLSTRKNIQDIKDENKLPLNEETLIDLELLSILANATDKTQRPFISRTIDFYKKVSSNEDSIKYFRNILKKRIIKVLQMVDKDKAYSLLDYISIIVENETVDLRSGLIFENIEWNNKNNHFMPKGGPSRALKESEIYDNELYKRTNKYYFPDNILLKFTHFLYLQLIFDVYHDKAKNEHIGPAINKLKSKLNDLQKVINFNCSADDIFKKSNIVIIDLNNANIEIKKTIPLLLSHKVYSEHKLIYQKNENKYLNIVVDEAHNILSYSSQRESESWKDYRLETFEEIIKEGRKFGVFLTVASQRPSDISSTIISQLHNYFLHRLINNKDIEAVEKTISYLDKVSFDALPILPVGSCVLAGLCAQIPVIIDIDKIEDGFEPNNKTIKPTDYWK